jgi:rhodanese-related sulfurtransferase
MGVANTSRHLQSLRAAKMVVVRRRGLFAFYRLADEKVFRACQAVRELGESRLTSLRELVRERRGDATETDRAGLIGLDELVVRVRDGDSLVVDVRPESEYQAGHIPGALSLPHDALEERLHVLPMDQEIIVYSRGPYCAFADTAVRQLRESGHRAVRFALGLPDWRAAGLPVDRA